MTHHKRNGRDARFNPDEREKDRGCGESGAVLAAFPAFAGM